jgi:ATP-dependent RNA helicase RhlE
LHGDMSQNQRESSLRKFESGHAPTLVATDVAARGLDVDDISHVINFDPPRTADDYTHRVGRTGRAGRTGTGVTFVLPEQRADVAALVRGLGGAHSEALAAAVPGAVVAAPAQRSTTPRRRRRR